MNHPFKVGDTVYHNFYGKGTIKELDRPNHVTDNGRVILVHFESVGLRQYSAKELSFTTWPKPDHERTEIWICHMDGGEELLIRGFHLGNVYTIYHDYTMGGVRHHAADKYIKIKQLK